MASKDSYELTGGSATSAPRPTRDHGKAGVCRYLGVVRRTSKHTPHGQSPLNSPADTRAHFSLINLPAMKFITGLLNLIRRVTAVLRDGSAFMTVAVALLCAFSAPSTASANTVPTGGSHSLYVTAAGDLYAMGHNGSGQLGDGTNTNRSTPVKVATDAVSIAAGSSHSIYRDAF